jgi:hypothetical protein
MNIKLINFLVSSKYKKETVLEKDLAYQFQYFSSSCLQKGTFAKKNGNQSTSKKIFSLSDNQKNGQ